jgi:DNA sulfur modification protein DndD
MILHKVELHNFGIYAGDTTFNLKTQADEQYQRPIILFRGQNGVGKTTLMEAIRFCLHGKLSLGSRVTQREYDHYLQRRLHRNEAGETAVSAAVQLEFEHIFLGRRQQYRVRRAWTNRLATELTIWIDDELFAGDEEEKEHLLRELVPVGVADLFFFDGEKIATLSEAGDAGDALLAESVKNLLGLHLVERLDRDLDVYLTRQTGIQEMHQHQAELTQLNEEEDRLREEHQETQAMLEDCRRALRRTRQEITLLEERISSEGGRYAAQQTSYKTERKKLEAALADVEQEIYELSRGVLPFAVAPKLLRAVQQRLEQEAAFEKWQAAQPLTAELQALVQTAVTESPASELPPIFSRLQQLTDKYAEAPVPETAVIHRVSPETKEVMSGWIEDALTTVPQQLVATMQRRDALKEQLATVKESLSRVPVIDLIQPLQEELQQRNREYGRLEVQEENFSQEEKRLAFPSGADCR